MSRELIEEIRNSQLSHSLSDEECVVLAGIVSQKQLHDDEVLITEGSVDDCLYVVLRGKIGVMKQTTGDEDTILHVLRQPDKWDL